jgi:hypothetical protein
VNEFSVYEESPENLNAVKSIYYFEKYGLPTVNNEVIL